MWQQSAHVPVIVDDHRQILFVCKIAKTLMMRQKKISVKLFREQEAVPRSAVNSKLDTISREVIVESTPYTTVTC